MYLDGLPNVSITYDYSKANPKGKTYGKNHVVGVPFGYKVQENGKTRYVINNHWKILVETAPAEDPGYFHIVHWRVDARSYKHPEDIGIYNSPHEMLYLDDLVKQGKLNEIQYSYKIVTQAQDKDLWINRLDNFQIEKEDLKNDHTLSLWLNLAFIFALSSVLACLMKRGINDDFNKWVIEKITRQNKRKNDALHSLEEEEHGILNNRS